MKPTMLFAFLIFLTLTTSGCKKDKINEFKGYGWGTVKIDADQTRYMVVDENIDFNLKGDLLGSEYTEGDRIFSRFIIDYDNQKEESSNLVKAFHVTFSEIVKFETTEVIPFSHTEPREIIPALFKPWITYDYLSGKDLITFQCSVYHDGNTDPKLHLMYAEDYVAGTTPLKLVLCYTTEIDKKEKLGSLFQSFIIPPIDQSKYQIEIQFDAKQFAGSAVNTDKKQVITLEFNQENSHIR